VSAPRPILVTGAHRSGTTWVGRMLALAPGVGYIHEPFSPATAPGISSAPFETYFTRITAQNEARYLPQLERTLAFRYATGPQVAALRTPLELFRAGRDALAFAAARRRKARPLVKDPIALLSADWLAERFDMDVVVTIRHPAAFAASVLRLGWSHDFSTFAGDERLRRFEPELQQPRDPLEEAALLWRLLYSIVDEYRRAHPDWAFVRHEDAARAPLETFMELYGRLGLELTPQARRTIERSSAADNPAASSKRHAIELNSAATAERWHTQLTSAEIARLREATQDVWPLFYADGDW
jgi:sulfotransferase family protein